MLRLDRVIKPWKESAALNDHINLYGFWNETAFLTKSGDVGMVLSVPGVDYESLDRSEQEYAVKRLEAALKAFGPGFHVYQYLFKSNRPDIPFARYDDPIVEAAIEQRRKFFEAKRDHLYQVEISYCILLEGARSKTGVGAALARLFQDPAGAVGELRAQFTSDNMKTLLRTHIERDAARLDQRVQAFTRQLSDFMQIEVLDRQGQFTFFRRLLNYDDWRVAGKPQSTQFLDYQVVNSNIEAERDHLRVGDHIVRILTMKEAVTETRPLALDALLKIRANFRVVTEWTPLAADKARKEVNKRRRHFNMSKTGFVSQMGNDATKTNPREVLVDESKQADIENLGDCLRALGDGQSLGDFSLTIVLYGRSKSDLEQLGAEFAGIFTNADGSLFSETYNQLNAYFATVPGNYALNLRKLYLLNTNYADLSFLFTILPGEKTNAHLGTEYLAVLETDNSTPYFLNLHNGEVAHTLILGMTGSGKSYFLQFRPAKCAKVRTADLHLRYWRKLPGAYYHLRRVIPERRPGSAGFHHQSVLASADQGKPAISLQLLPCTHRRQRTAVPAGLQRRAPPVGCHRAHVHAGTGPAHRLELYEHRWRIEGAFAPLDARRPVRFSLR
jgi:type IV secretion system protein VirB4